MTRQQIQEHIDVLCSGDTPVKTYDELTSLMQSWISSQGVSLDDAQRICSDIKSYRTSYSLL